MSPRRLEGWEPAEVTLHTYEDGNLVASVTIREPEYSPDDVALMIASRREENVPRNQFGVPMSEATDPANNPYDPRATGRWEVEVFADFAAASIEKAKEARAKAIPEGDWPLVWTAKRVDR